MNPLDDSPFNEMNGALLIHKASGVSSFGVIETLQRELLAKFGGKRRDLPKMGHGGTLDPFATGLLVVLVGRGVKLARYFLGSKKTYEGIIRFGETTIPGDPTDPISETSTVLPSSLAQLQELGVQWTQSPYAQIPPMHSAKKRNGKPLYELARAGIEVDREPRICEIFSFEIPKYEAPLAEFRVQCGSGTYIRTLAQDFAKRLGTVAMLNTLHRTQSGHYSIAPAWKVEQIAKATQEGTLWNQLPCWVPFDRLLDGYAKAEASDSERLALTHGKQMVLEEILKTVRPSAGAKNGSDDWVAIFNANSLVAVARRENHLWGIERVF